MRLFNIQGRPGETLMDTLGMAAFALPDLQCHFVGLDPGRVASCLYGYAEYLFQNGRVIDSGHTVQGLTPGSKWSVRSEESLVEPAREVLDLDPGPGKNAR